MGTLIVACAGGQEPVEHLRPGKHGTHHPRSACWAVSEGCEQGLWDCVLEVPPGHRRGRHHGLSGACVIKHLDFSLAEVRPLRPAFHPQLPRTNKPNTGASV